MKTDTPTPAAPETADLLAEARILAQTYRRPGMRDDNRVANILDALRSEVATLRASEARMREALDKANELLAASRELAQLASYAEIVGGISINRPHIRKWCDAVFTICKTLPEDENYEPTFTRAALQGEQQ